MITYYFKKSKITKQIYNNLIVKFNIVGEYSLLSKMSGSSKEGLYERHSSFNNIYMNEINLDGITIVRDKKSAEKAIKVLKMHQNR